MELITTHRIYYSNKQHIPLSEIAESLLALDGLIRQTPDVLELIFPGTQIRTVEVYIDELRSGSLYEDVIIKFIFGSQEKLDEFIRDARKHLKFDDLKNNKQIFSAVLVVLTLLGGKHVYDGLAANKANKTQIENNVQITINVGAELLGLTPQELRSAIEMGVKDKNKLAKDAVDFVKPAKRDSEAIIQFDNNPQIQIGAESVKAMPSHIGKDEPEESIQDYDRVEVQIRAVDLDSYKRGWAGIVPEVSTRRVKIQLDPAVDGEKLMQRPDVTGRITVLYRQDEQGNQVPCLYFLREIYEYR